MAIKVSVQQGRGVRVNSVRAVVESLDVVVLEADLTLKRAEIVGFSEDVVYIGGGGPETALLRVRCFPEQTVDATVSKYTLRIYVRAKSETYGREVWSDAASSRRLGANKATE